MDESPWLAYASPLAYADPLAPGKQNGSAALRLFCFPHAGGGAGAYRDWVAALAPEIVVLPIQLPGRETRFLERPFNNMDSLLDGLVEGIRPYLDTPFAFFGHSLGALIGFELARRLRAEGLFPQHLFVSGYGAPHMPVLLPPMHHLEDHDFIAALDDMETIPTAVLESEELLALLLPMLRADFAVYERYRYQEAAPLNCPITMLGGDADPLVTQEMLAGWEKHSTQPCGMHIFSGDHFYIQAQKTAVWQVIQERCLVEQASQAS